MSSFATSSTANRILGRVKWFNNKAGYGFITVTDGARSGTDIFIHHSAISVLNQQYKYLVQGEYVEFSLVSTHGGVHEFNACDVSGIKGGKLMCETRLEFKNTKKVSERFGAAFDEVMGGNAMGGNAMGGNAMGGNETTGFKHSKVPPYQNRTFHREKQDFTSFHIEDSQICRFR